MRFKTNTAVYEIRKEGKGFVVKKIASLHGDNSAVGVAEYRGDKIIVTDRLELLDNGRPTLLTSHLDFSSFQL